VRGGSDTATFDTNQLQFVAGIPLHDCAVGTEAVELLVFFGIAQFDQYLPPFTAVSDGDLRPEDVLG